MINKSSTCCISRHSQGRESELDDQRLSNERRQAGRDKMKFLFWLAHKNKRPVDQVIAGPVCAVGEPGAGQDLKIYWR